MKKILLIAGCSHTAGSEIDGTNDSEYNRQHSFGNVLATKMGYEPVNIASPLSTNHTIARSIIDWFADQYDATTMEVFVLVAWTESTRMEIPDTNICWYERRDPHADWYAASSRHFKRLNQGYKGGNAEEKEMMPYYHRFMATHDTYLEIQSANAVLQLQYFFNMHKVKYVMCNTMHMFNAKSSHVNLYLTHIDSTKYMDMTDTDAAFFWKYRNAGYINPKAQYWHHDEIPHSMYSDALYDFIERNKCL